MTQTAEPTATERAHKAAKRYIYAWGDGAAEGIPPASAGMLRTGDATPLPPSRRLR